MIRLERQSNVKIISFQPNFSNTLRNHDFLLGASRATLWGREYYNIPCALISAAEHKILILSLMNSSGLIRYAGHISSLNKSIIINQKIIILKKLLFLRYKSL